MASKYFYGRVSSHINDDLKRNWSSLNFGSNGTFFTDAEFEEFCNEIREKAHNQCAGDVAMVMSGFQWTYAQAYELLKNDLIRPLYREGDKGYYVVVDEYYSDALACFEIEAETEQEAIGILLKNGSNPIFVNDYCLPRNAKLVFSYEDLHLFVEEYD